MVPVPPVSQAIVQMEATRNTIPKVRMAVGTSRGAPLSLAEVLGARDAEEDDFSRDETLVSPILSPKIAPPANRRAVVPVPLFFDDAETTSESVGTNLHEFLRAGAKGRHQT